MNKLVKLCGHKPQQLAVDKIYYVVISESTDINTYLQRIQSGILTGYYYTIAATAPTTAPTMGIIGGIIKQKRNPKHTRQLLPHLHKRS